MLLEDQVYLILDQLKFAWHRIKYESIFKDIGSDEEGYQNGPQYLYICIYICIIMAKTIMIGNEVYHRLKRMKHDKSFTVLIKTLLDKKDEKTGKGLQACAGLLGKEDTLSEDAIKKSKGAFREWAKKYA